MRNRNLRIQALLLVSVAIFSGCASVIYHRERVLVDPTVAPADYIVSLKDPVTKVTWGFILDGGSSGVRIEDVDGRVAKVWWDWSGSNQNGFRKAGNTWYGRDFGEIVLGNLQSGRSLIIPSEEASRLLGILESAQKRHVDEDDDLSYFIDDLRKKAKGPIQLPQASTVSGRH